MIKFSKKNDPLPADSDENRFDFIRRTAAEKHRKIKSDDDDRRSEQAIEDEQPQ